MVDNLENFEICYMEDPMEPIIISNLKINNQPFRYKRYSSKKGLEYVAITNEDSNRFRIGKNLLFLFKAAIPNSNLCS